MIQIQTSSGLVASDKIQLIIGLAISLPGTIATVVGAIYGCKQYQKHHPKAPGTDAEQPIQIQPNNPSANPNLAPDIRRHDWNTDAVDGVTRTETRTTEAAGGTSGLEIETRQTVPALQGSGTDEGLPLASSVPVDIAEIGRSLNSG
jgi:hypothetical protein